MSSGNTTPLPKEQALDIMVLGLVQGVGFRPFIYNLATNLHLAGWIRNRNDGVHIRVQGDPQNITTFLEKLRHHAPPLAHIEDLNSTAISVEALTDFQIIHSQSDSAAITQVSPDVAVCQACLNDMCTQPHRLNYPFINCTNCGPRFSIIQDLPYDRQQTTMQVFTMCPLCQREYDDLHDRRFHAQPNACWQCGPRYTLFEREQTISDFEHILERVCTLLDTGKIVAIKGVGGFHLACDAGNEEAVATLRERKHREGKPFAVMMRDIEHARRYAPITLVEEQLLRSQKRPIVLVKKNPKPSFPKLPLTLSHLQREGEKRKDSLAPSVTRGLDTLGIMLPYTPLHYALFERLKTDTIVLTSGNLSDEPIVISHDEAQKHLFSVADALLVYNRDIHNRSDDSVAVVINETPRLLRRSRGWAPEPVMLPFEVEGILAAGAELKNCFCVGKGRYAILSQHIGDLKNFETYTFYQEAFTRFQRLFRVEPKLIACDLHPDYLSSKFARETGLPLVQVQHHHAHIAACMAEFGLAEPVIGISFDGAGLGADRAIWGGEFLMCDLTNYQRVSHFDYVPMPGGDKAAEQPWRMGLAYLYATFGRDFLDLDVPMIAALEPKRMKLLLSAIDKQIQCPPTSSVGRLFDAVAAIVNLVSHTTFEAEAPIRLEAAIDDTLYRTNSIASMCYPYTISTTIDVKPLIEALVYDISRKVAVSEIAAKFHQTLVTIIVDMAKCMRQEYGLHTVILSGGVFQNRHLLEKAETTLQADDFAVYSPLQVPANDGGLCLGQLAIAAMRNS